jgi:hypothetical protein
VTEGAGCPVGPVRVVVEVVVALDLLGEQAGPGRPQQPADKGEPDADLR